MVKNQQHMIMYKLFLTKVSAQVQRQSDDDVPLACLPSTSTMHSPVIKTESESRIEFDSKDDETIANIPTKMANKDQLADQNQTNKVRKGIPGCWHKRPPHFVNSSFTGKPFPNTTEQDLSPQEYFNMFFDESLYDITTY